MLELEAAVVVWWGVCVRVTSLELPEGAVSPQHQPADSALLHSSLLYQAH